MSEQQQNIWKALQYMLFSVSAFTVLNACVKYLDSISPYQIVFFRAAGTLILCLVLLRVRGISLRGTHQGLLIARGVVGTISMAFFFFAVKELPFGSAVSLRYLSPIFAALLAMLWLKERITVVQWFCFLMAFAGVLVLKGFDPRVSILGLSYILLSAFFSGMVYVLIRRIGLREHPIVIVTYFMICATLIGGVLSIGDWRVPVQSDYWAIGALGLFGFFGQFFMTKAYQIASVGVVAPMKYLESIFALLIGWIWFGEGYEISALLGIVLIVGGMLLNIFVKRRA